jgi:conjugal transfer pilus assembly protein TrbC
LLLILVLFALISFPAQADVLQKDIDQLIERALQDQTSVQGQAHTLLKSVELNKRSCHMQSGVFPPNAEKSSSSTLLLCVTLSMNDAALKAYDLDLRKVGGRMVIRGLIDDSFLKTAKRLKHLGIEVDIDPTVFEAFKVERVPTFIHVQGRPGAYDNIHDRMTGNVSVLYAFEEFERSGDLDATLLVNKMRGAS